MPKRVDPRVGAAGSHHPKVIAEDPSRGGEEEPLNRRHPRLDLPAGIRGAIIGKDQPQGASGSGVVLGQRSQDWSNSSTI